MKKSYGIICCRQSQRDGIEIVMVKMATTYHFCEFVSGRYNSSNVAHLMELFNNMTYHEKMDILSLKFGQMWYRQYREHSDNVFFQGSSNKWLKLYLNRKSKFECTFLQDGGVKLSKMIKSSYNSDSIWVFPKGRKNGNESDLITAMREFEEETNISSDKYEVLVRIPPYIETYIDFNVTYQNIYYFAKAIGNWEPKYSFNKIQTTEVETVKWISMNKLKSLDLNRVTLCRMLKQFRQIIAKYKNKKHHNPNLLSVQVPTEEKLP